MPVDISGYINYGIMTLVGLLVAALFNRVVSAATREWPILAYPSRFDLGTASLTAQAGQIPIADAQARLDPSWANALGVAPLLLPQAFLVADRIVARGNIVLTPGTASIPSGVTVSVDEQAQWVITGDGYSVLQYQADGSVREVQNP